MVWGSGVFSQKGLGEVRKLYDLSEANDLNMPHYPTPSLVASLDVGLQMYRRFAA